MGDNLRQKINAYQRLTFRDSEQLRIKTIDQAVEFVNQRGFIFFWPLKEFTFPSLWAAVAGNRPVADQHDDPGHITWDWKDSLLSTRRWYYSKLLRNRNTIVSNDLLPNFYALSPNYGDYQSDYLTTYSEGSLSSEAKALYESLLFNGPLDTISLRKSANLTSASSNSRFTRAINKLQSDFMVMPVGVSHAGAWNYAYTYDIPARYLPHLIDQTRFIDDHQAVRIIIRSYVKSVGYCDVITIRKLFAWKDELIKHNLAQLEETSLVKQSPLKATDQNTVWVLSELLS